MRIARVSPEAWLLAAICVADLLLTLALVVSGRAHEANPVLRYYLEISLGSFVAVKCLLIAGPLFVLELLRSRRPRFVQLALRAGIMLYLLTYGAGVYHINYQTRAEASEFYSVHTGE